MAISFSHAPPVKLQFESHAGLLPQPSGHSPFRRKAVRPALIESARSHVLRQAPGLHASAYLGCSLSHSFVAAATRRMRHLTRNGRRQGVEMATNMMPFKVAILGSAGGIGQPLALLMKMNPLVSHVHCYDIGNVKGVAADLSHCNTPAKVLAFTGPDELGAALVGMDLVIIPAGVPRKPGMTRDDLFKINAGIVKTLAEAVAMNAPKALIHVISNPVNSTVPIAAEVLKERGVYDPAKLMGVTTLDVVRANTFVAEAKNLKLIDTDVPVIGGHAGITILPLLSQTRPKTKFTEEEVLQLTDRIQNGGTEVVNAKAGAGSATLSMAYAAARFAESCLRGLDGDPDVYECTYVQSNIIPDLPFFASRVKLGRKGVEGFVPLENLSEFEKQSLEALKPELKGSIEKGLAFLTKAKEPAAV